MVPFTMHPSCERFGQYRYPQYQQTLTYHSPDSASDHWKSLKVSLIPPCRICGGVSSGFHYGVYTCEACKGFYRRSFFRKRKYKCKSENKDCILNPGRNLCPYCRYQKCCQMGMSKDAIKIGRYTYERKTMNIRELKCLQRGISASDSDDEDEDDDDDENEEDENNNEEDNEKDSIARSSSQSASYNALYNKPISIKQEPEFDVLSTEDLSHSYASSGASMQRPTTSMACDSSELDDKNAIHDWITEHFHAGFRFGQIEDSYSDITRIIVDADKRENPFTDFLENSHDVERKQRKHYETEALKREHFGRLHNLSREEYEMFYHATGIALDCRQDIRRHVFECMERCTAKIIRFAKSIPGFKALPTQDQILLIRGSYFEVWYLSAFRGFDADLEVAFTDSGNIFHIDEARCAFDEKYGGYLCLLFEFCDSLKRLCLSREELAVLKAIAVMFSDRFHLENAKFAEEVQLKLITCFRLQLQRNHPCESGLLFARAMDRLTALRNLSALVCDFCNHLKTDFPELYNYPLLCETMGIDIRSQPHRPDYVTF